MITYLFYLVWFNLINIWIIILEIFIISFYFVSWLTFQLIISFCIDIKKRIKFYFFWRILYLFLFLIFLFIKSLLFILYYILTCTNRSYVAFLLFLSYFYFLFYFLIILLLNILFIRWLASLIFILNNISFNYCLLFISLNKIFCCLRPYCFKLLIVFNLLLLFIYYLFFNLLYLSWKLLMILFLRTLKFGLWIT